MKLDGGLLLAYVMVGVAGCQILFHWLLGREVFPAILAIYLSADAGGKHFYGGIVDNVAPAIVLGWVNGWVGYPRWSTRRLLATTFTLALFVVVLMPVYRPLIGPEHFATVWGTPASTGVFSYVFRFSSALLITGFFTRAAYVFRRDWKPRYFNDC
jgi:hypothetical protein